MIGSPTTIQVEGYGRLAAAGAVPTVLQYNDGPNQGIAVTTLSNTVMEIELIGPSTTTACSTPEGIHSGSSAADVQRAYGVPPYIVRIADGRFSTWLYDTLGLRVQLAGPAGEQTVPG